MRTFKDAMESGAMDSYSNFMRHGFDRDTWYMVAGQSRDSEPLEQSNFAVALDMLGGEEEGKVEVHRFGHWAVGWIEELFVNPAALDKVKIAQEIRDRLEDYPVLDDEDFSQREYDLACHYWEFADIADRVEAIQEFREGEVSIFAARRDELPCLDIGSYIAP